MGRGWARRAPKQEWTPDRRTPRRHSRRGYAVVRPPVGAWLRSLRDSHASERRRRRRTGAPELRPASLNRVAGDQVKLVVVTGSGRSGTSSVAGTLKRLGLYIPQPEVETDERNPRGYYEPLWVAEFHKWLLNPIPVRTIDSRPNAGKIAKKAVTPEVEQQLRDWLRGQLQTGETQILLKDTRAYWVYDLWQRMADEFGAQLTSLTMLRHPAQVVRSRDTAYLSDMDRHFRRQRETTNVAAWINAAFETERVTRGNAARVRAVLRPDRRLAGCDDPGRRPAGPEVQRHQRPPPGRRLHRRRPQPLQPRLGRPRGHARPGRPGRPFVGSHERPRRDARRRHRDEADRRPAPRVRRAVRVARPRSRSTRRPPRSPRSARSSRPSWPRPRPRSRA